MKVFKTIVCCSLSIGMLLGCSPTSNNPVAGSKPAITTQPQAQTIAAGQNVTFTVVATGSAPLSYQWKKNGSNSSIGTDSSSYTIVNVKSTDSGTYTVVVTNSNGSAESNPAKLTVVIVSPNDITAAIIKTDEADSALESALASNPSLTTLDVTAPNKLYTDAIALNPANTQAQFGAAITELLALTQNQEFQTFLDSLQISSPSATGMFKSSVIPIKLNGNAAVSSEKIVLRLANATASQVPKISALQKIVNDSTLPVFSDALARFAIVENDPAFVFKITPKMTGGQDTFNLDNGEVFVIDAGLRIIQASLLALISYNVDVDMNGSYSWLLTSSAGFSDDSTRVAYLKQLLTPGSAFLALNPWGKTSMQGVSANLRTSLTKLQDAITEIDGETHDQSHDIIKINDLDSVNSDLANGSSGYNSISSVIDTIAKVLNGPYLFTNGSVSVTVNFTAIFDNPIQDLKTKFPSYRWIDPTQWRTVDTTYEYEYIGDSYIAYPVYDTTVAIPVVFQDANGADIPWDSLSFDNMYFPDYTFGGLFPGLTKAGWDNLINSVNSNSPTPPSSPLASFSNSYAIGVPLAKLLK